jgi:hypothetical protein
MKNKPVHICITLLLVFFSLTSCNKATDPDLDYSVAEESSFLQLSGQPDEIPADNCGGETESVQTFRRSRSFQTELEVDVSQEVAAEFGGDFKLAKAAISKQIGLALGVRFGTETETSSELEISTPPGAKTTTTVQWKEKWTMGNISIERPDGTSVDLLPFAALNSLVLEQQGITTIKCGGNDGEEVIIEDDAREVLPTAPPIVKSGRFDVLADVMKNPTGIFVKEGDMMHFEYLSGEWTGDKFEAGLTSGCGFTWDDPYDGHTWLFPPEQRGAALVGYVDGQPFWVGCNPIDIVAPTSGEIYLGMSDCRECFWDNEGVLKVKVTINGQ